MFEDVIREKKSSGAYESIKSRFTASINLKELPSVLKNLLQKGTYDMTNGEAIKMNIKLLLLCNFCTRYHQLMIRYHAP